MRADKKDIGGGKVEFVPHESTYVSLKSSTANVRYIEEHIKKTWGDDYILVSKEGVPICDTTATQRKIVMVQCLHNYSEQSEPTVSKVSLQ